MKKRNISLILVICLLVSMFPTTIFASQSSGDKAKEAYYEYYTAIGDSICAGFSQVDYNYHNGLELNINDSPKLCYPRLTGKTLGSNVYNLGKLGCNTKELLDILTNQNNKYYSVYREYIKESNLITLGIGSNDLSMPAIGSILKSMGGEYADMEPMEVFSLAVAICTGDIPGVVHIIEKMIGKPLTKEQMQAILVALSDEALSATLETGYKTFCENYPKVVEQIRAINSKAEFVILNYYNPNKGMHFNWGDISYNTGDVIQATMDKMNKFTLNYCQNKDYVYVDISDTPTNKVDPHPSTAGHAKIAYRICDALLNTVSATAQSGGSISPAGKSILKYRESMDFSIAPDSGYEISDVLVDGKSVGNTKTYTLTDVRADHFITANFRKAEDCQVSLDKTSANIKVGDSINLVATVTPTDALNKNVTWSSNDTSVATVDSNGKVTAVSKGTATITVTTVAGNKTASCSVVVSEDAIITPIRYGGINRYETAVKVSKAGWSKSKNVVLANAYGFADALTGVPFAYIKDAPILLTDTNSMPKVTSDEVKRLGAKNVYILGGTGVVSQILEDELKGNGYNVVRLSGLSRFETSLQIGSEVMKNNSSKTAVLTTAYDYPDALAISSFAAINKEPILYTEVNTLTASTKEFIKNNGITNIIIPGGTAAVSEEVANELRNSGITVERIAGKDRYNTALNIACKYKSRFKKEIMVATGNNYPDALTGGVLAAKKKIPTLLVDKDFVEADVKSYIKSNCNGNIYFLGGTGVISDNLVNTIVN